MIGRPIINIKPGSFISKFFIRNPVRLKYFNWKMIISCCELSVNCSDRQTQDFVGLN